MIAYDKILFENTLLASQATRLENSRFISKDQLAAIHHQLPVLKSQHNFLVRIGFFLLGSFLYGSIIAAIALFVYLSDNSSDTSFKVIALLFTLVGLGGSEFLARKKYYEFGIDDAFIIGMQMCLCVFVNEITNGDIGVPIAMGIAGAISCLRYSNWMSALFCCIGFTGVFFSLIVDVKLIPISFLPFIMMLVAIALYVAFYTLDINSKSYFYKNSLQMVKTFSLSLLYLSGNYLVVRELTELVLYDEPTKKNDIPLAFLFYCFTFAIPVFYLIYGLVKKDRTMLIMGLVCFAFSVFTIRFYHSILPLEQALTLGGIVLFIITFLFIKKIKHKTTGLTFMPGRGADKNSLLNTEAFIIASQLNAGQPSPTENNIDFGGGGFSGGGSQSSF